MRKIIKGPKTTWVDIQDPNDEDIKYLKERFKLHPLVLGELIPPGYRPKVECYKNYLFMILYYPIYSKERRETRPRELDIIVTKEVLITSHYKSILPVGALFNTCNLYQKSRKSYMSEGTGQLLFFLLSGFWKNCLIKLERIDKRIDDAEKKIFAGREKEMVLEISLIKTDIINFWRIIESQQETLKSLFKEGASFWGEHLTPYFSDLLGTYNQAWNDIKTLKETILALENTNQSLLSAKINEIIKVLTVFSVIFLPLTLIASIWGMNISKMPLIKSSTGFWMILSLMVAMIGIMILFFKKKKWL